MPFVLHNVKQTSFFFYSFLSTCLLSIFLCFLLTFHCLFVASSLPSFVSFLLHTEFLYLKYFQFTYSTPLFLNGTLNVHFIINKYIFKHCGHGWDWAQSLLNFSLVSLTARLTSHFWSCLYSHFYVIGFIILIITQLSSLFIHALSRRTQVAWRTVVGGASENAKVTHVPIINRKAHCFRERSNIQCYLKYSLKTKHRNDDAWYAMPHNLIFPINYDSDTRHIGKIYCGRWVQIFFLCAQVYWNQ